jgi:glycosyltransferase involved in cell wall biosynthesis
MNPTVSIVTVTQYSRRHCLTHLAMLIKQQIYTNITEWVIVEGSKTAVDAEENARHIIEEIKDFIMVPIVYISFEADQYLSDLRNAGNEACKGEIIVCMDDDDYYPPTRVSHAVHMLTHSTKGALIAGCSPAYIYFYATSQFFQFKSFGTTHSTNNCMAYKRSYLKTHAHAPGLDKAEESSFTNNFTEPMEQLDPAKTIIISGHANNTVDKNWLAQSKKSYTMATEITSAAVILDYIPLPILMKMEKIFEEMKAK